MSPRVSITAATDAVAAVDPVMARLRQRIGPVRLRAALATPFAALARSIVYQQLSGFAATAIHQRLVETLGGEVTPEAVLAAPAERLRAAGLSAAKTLSIIDLAERAVDGTIPSAARIRRMPDDEIIERLVVVRGIGRWTAEMFLIFSLLRPDVFPLDDLGLQKGIRVSYFKGRKVSLRTLQRLGEGWRPWRSVATWYLWRSLDPVPVEY